jgi:hypothetical protein
MAIRYLGTNPVFLKLVHDINHVHPIAEAVSTGRFRSHDKDNRNKYPVTAALLDCMASPYSRKLRIWHHRILLCALKAKCSCNRCIGRAPVDKYSAVELDFIDME